MNVSKFFKHHAQSILTGLSMIGLASTTILAVKATPKAIELIESDSRRNHDGDPHGYTIPEAIQSSWKCYIPALAIGAATGISILSMGVINRRQQNALMGAYILLDRTYKNYKTKVNEIFGDNANQLVQSAMVRDRIEEDKPKFGCEKAIFYEEHYGKFFERSIAEVLDAEYQLNRKFAKNGEVTINDFFHFLGLSEIEIGDALGWSQEIICDFSDVNWIDFEHECIELDDGMECYVINILTPSDRIA